MPFISVYSTVTFSCLTTFLYKSGKETKEERKKLLENQQKILKAKIDKMQKAYKLLTDKIDLYNSGKIDEYLDISIKNN